MSIRAINFYFDNAKALGYTPAEQVVMLIFADQSRDEGDAFPSVATVTNKTTMSEDNIKRILSDLQARGEIVRVARVRPNGSQRSSVTLLVKYRKAYNIRDDYSKAETEALKALKAGGSTVHPTPAPAQGEGGTQSTQRGASHPPLDPVIYNQDHTTYASASLDEKKSSSTGTSSDQEPLILDETLEQPRQHTKAARGKSAADRRAAVADTKPVETQAAASVVGSTPVTRTKPSDHPAIQAYRHRFGRFPSKPQMGLIIDAADKHPDWKLENWEKALDNWAGRNYKPTNISGLLDLALHKGGEFEPYAGAAGSGNKPDAVQGYKTAEIAPETIEWMKKIEDHTFTGGVGYIDNVDGW